MITKIINDNKSEHPELYSNLTGAEAATQCAAMHSACGKEPKKRPFSGHGKWVKCNEKANDDCAKLTVAEASSEAGSVTAAGVTAALSTPNTASVAAPSNSKTLLLVVIAAVVIGGLFFAFKKPSAPAPKIK